MSSIEDELALRALMARYVDAVNRRDGDAWITTWADDASWHLMGQAATGRDHILATWEQMMANFEFAVMMPSSCLFEVQGDSASGHWYLQEFTRDHDGNAASVLSRYRDTYYRIAGQWLYTSRAYDVMYFGPADLSAGFNPLPN